MISSTGNRKNSEKKERSERAPERSGGKRKISKRSTPARGETRKPHPDRQWKALKKSVIRFVQKNRVWLLCAAAAFLAAWLVSAFFVQLVLIRDGSMEPAYHNGQIVAVSKLRREYQRGDVIVFDAPQLGCRLVKRIAHVPGDHLSPEEATMYGRGTLAGYTLPEGAYLVLGDNADESVDSRDERVGVVRSEKIVGKVMW